MKKILMVGSEALPFASTGGLGDVLGSLPAALKEHSKQELEVRVVIPLYSSIDKIDRDKMTFIGAVRVPLAWRSQYCGVMSLEHNGITYYFIDNEYYFKRNLLYGAFDDAERYAFFNRAVLEMLPLIDFFPDILHAHDWQSALSVIYLKQKYGMLESYSSIKAVFTIHNILYQGQYGLDILSDVFDLEPHQQSVVEYNGDINLMKGAIVCCDKLTTVSPKYAEEIQTEEFGYGLQEILRQNRYKMVGILNGIDTDYYNPRADNELYSVYNAVALKIRRTNKTGLQKLLGLPESEQTPVIAMVTRLTAQKGLDLVKCVLEELLSEELQFILLGTGDKEYEDFFQFIEGKYPQKARCILAYDKALSKKIYAAADIFIMPSKTEPCGLSQMIASRYGAVPVVRETGGLYDSIKHYYCEEEQINGNGFTFYDYNAHELLYVVHRALALYTNEPKKWSALVRKVMQIDFSWNASAKKYRELVDELV